MEMMPQQCLPSRPAPTCRSSPLRRSCTAPSHHWNRLDVRFAVHRARSCNLLRADGLAAVSEGEASWESPHGVLDAGALELPGIAVLQPDVGQLLLKAVLDSLPEHACAPSPSAVTSAGSAGARQLRHSTRHCQDHPAAALHRVDQRCLLSLIDFGMKSRTVLVADAVAPPGVVQGGQGVHKACRQAAQPAITQRLQMHCRPAVLQVLATFLLLLLRGASANIARDLG